MKPDTEPTVAGTPFGRALARFERHRVVVAMLSFAFGASSFVLMQRDERVARWIAVLLLASWLLMLGEGSVGRLWSGQRWARLPPLALRYLTQLVHQATFFFCLPFFFYTTTWFSGQLLFTALMAAAALVSMWDPVYYGLLSTRPAAYFGYHALAVYAAALTLPPILWQLTTTESLIVASAAIGLLALPSLGQLLLRGRRRRWLWLPVLGLALGGGAWLARPWVPPATLWVSDASIAASLNPASRQPGPPLTRVPQSALADGIYAYTPIHAPRGLRERVFHVWRHDGRTVDRIPLRITGGRKQGYRAWSYKRSFPVDAAGAWTVRVVTGAGQLIGELRFRVIPAPAEPAPPLSGRRRTSASAP